MRKLGLVSVALLLVLSYAPSIWLVVLSVLSTRVDLGQAHFTLENYSHLLADTRWIAPLQKSAVLALLAALLATPTALFVGRVAGRHRHGIWLLAICLLPALVPGVVMGTALFTLLRPVAGLKLGEWSVLLGQVLWAVPFCAVLFFLRYKRFDVAWLEAAATLGMTKRATFLKVELPILRSTIGASLIFSFILAFTELPRSSFLRGATTTLPIFQWTEVSAHASQAAITFGLSSILLVVSSIAITAIIFRQQGAE